MTKVKVEKELFEALQNMEKNGAKGLETLVKKKALNWKFASKDYLPFNHISLEDSISILKNGYELAKTDIDNNEILKNVHELLMNQSLKGFQKYGEFVKAENLTTEQWIDHASEELIDTLVYLQCIKQSMKERIDNEFGDKS